jgi:hypothetical protein
MDMWWFIEVNFVEPEFVSLDSQYNWHVWSFVLSIGLRTRSKSEWLTGCQSQKAAP